MTYTVDVQNEADYAIDADRLTQAAHAALRQQNTPADCNLTIVITDDDAVQALNQQFRGVSAPTDVLSFPFSETGYLGDLVIAYPYASQQATREGHPLMDNMMLLVVHGVLHLLGYDHDTQANRAAMWAQQAAILDVLGIAQSLVPDLEQGMSHE
jgi:probable rRNA maturation factor